ncbi:hypothetical protein ONZ45_g4311 [Pleurotus djamor]|nr:hypothetical protein ONZ45_g4311 [Pleurotus djamor]
MGIRHFTIMVGERYEHLWNVKTVAEFEDLYVDIVECHWYAYRYVGILHRDLSKNNLMFRRKNGRVFGVVIDWDLASPFNKASGPRDGLTGTGPFMARDILLSKNETIGHLDRHDLESLFYVLIWGACHYVLGGASKQVRSPAVLARWLGDFVFAAACKNSFITDDSWRDDIFNVVVFEDTSIIDRWLRPVWDLFFKAHIAKAGGGIDLSLSLTFDAYMTALKRQPRLPTADYPLPPESSFT